MKLSEDKIKEILFAFSVGATVESVMACYEKYGLKKYKAYEFRKIAIKQKTLDSD